MEVSCSWSVESLEQAFEFYDDDIQKLPQMNLPDSPLLLSSRAVVKSHIWIAPLE